MPTGQNLSEVQRKCGVRGRTELDEGVSTMIRKREPGRGGGRPQRGEEELWHHSPRQKPSRGRRGGGGGSHDGFPGVEISIAGVTNRD